MLVRRSPTVTAAQLLLHLMNLYGVEERDGNRFLFAGVIHACRSAHMNGRDTGSPYYQA